MTLHKAGYSLLIILLVIMLLIDAAILYFYGFTPIFWWISGILLIVYVFTINFFRFPNRVIILDNNLIMAPADGKVVVIEETTENEVLNTKCIQVSIFMSIINVHINWFPVNGLVTYVKHHKGKFQAAYLPKSSTENERSTIVIDCINGEKVLMRQIAGAMAKRIVTYATIGTKARQDKHAGFIKFGSRVDLFLPLDSKINVKLGDKTIGSQTVIGSFK